MLETACGLSVNPSLASSLVVNALVGTKISIVSATPQTTRNRIVGILNREAGQAVLLDLPGVHEYPVESVAGYKLEFDVLADGGADHFFQIAQDVVRVQVLRIERLVATETQQLAREHGGPIRVADVYGTDKAGGNALAIARDYTLDNLAFISEFAAFDSNHLGLVRPDGTGADALFKQHLNDPWALEDMRSVPGVKKLVAIATGHHTLPSAPVSMMSSPASVTTIR